MSQTSKSTSSSAEREATLDLSAAELAELSAEVNRLVIDYFEGVANRALFPQQSGGDTIAEVGAELSSAGESLEKLLADCRAILAGSRHNGHPRFFGYVASPATPIGAYGDLIASALNANVTSWRSGPAATEIERTVVRWLGSLIGFSDDAGGLLTSGGSLANTIAMLIAQRHKAGREVVRSGLWNQGPPMTIYASEEVHMSIPKAADVLGFGREQVRTVDCDERFRLDVRSLRERLEQDHRNGLQPFCVVASAGTVNTGAVDPLAEIAVIAREFGIWFHVDGAYGAPGSLDQRKRLLFAGLELADSVSLDPHKWLYVPLDAGCLLFRDETAARAAFAAGDADYIKVLEENATESFAFWDYGTELSRRFRALKIWMTLRYYGTNRLAKAISEDISLANYLAERVEQADDFELLAPVELSICCFRYVPPQWRDRLAATDTDVALERELDDLNQRIMLTVQRGGSAYVSNATIRGKFALRACITNFRTTRADIDKTLESIRAAAATVT